VNRPHVAALLREIAFEAEVTARLVGGQNNPPEIEAEIDGLISQMAKRLRVRAGEIEAGQN
jgi:hypothetical protein